MGAPAVWGSVMRTIFALGIALLPAALFGACSGETDATYPGGSGGTTATGGGGAGLTGGSGLSGGGGSISTGGGGAVPTGGGGQGPAGGSGGAGGSGPIACVWSAEGDPCDQGTYCDTPNCGAGVCVPVGTTEDTAFTPQCGCDTVNYWNASVAARYGMPVAHAGDCGQGAKSCSGVWVNPCPDDRHYCDHRRQAAVNCGGADMPGICWGMPAACPNIMFADHRPCLGTSPACINRCEAIKSEAPYYPDGSCPQ